MEMGLKKREEVQRWYSVQQGRATWSHKQLWRRMCPASSEGTFMEHSVAECWLSVEDIPKRVWLLWR